VGTFHHAPNLTHGASRSYPFSIVDGAYIKKEQEEAAAAGVLGLNMWCVASFMKPLALALAAARAARRCLSPHARPR
jgi:hypothetical protein